MTKQNSNKFQPMGRAYQLAKQLANQTYDVTASLPKDEFRLIGQMRGAAVSVFGNIAEGYGRNSIGDYIRFCEIARGSLAELSSYFEFCQERNLLEPKTLDNLLQLYNQTWNTLGALIRSLRQKKLDGVWDRTYQTLKEGEELYDA
ncbi:MAG: four helix bundle protein [Chloroflexota bacterium]